MNIIRNEMKASNKLESLTIWIKFQLPKVKGRHDMFIMDILQTMKSQSTKLSLLVAGKVTRGLRTSPMNFSLSLIHI